MPSNIYGSGSNAARTDAAEQLDPAVENCTPNVAVAAELGTYSAGLGTQREAVVTAHFMHEQNCSSWRMLADEDFAEKAVYMAPDEVATCLIAQLKASSNAFIKKRAEAAKKRAKQHYKVYGLSSAVDVTDAEIIVEAITDNMFRKTHISDQDKRNFRDKIAAVIAKGETIRLVAPMLPHKIESPIKVRGSLPGLAEAVVIVRLGEIAGVVDSLYPNDKRNPDVAGAEFVVVADGRRFQTSLHVPEQMIQCYQDGVQWWIDQLGFTNTVKIVDYEVVMNERLTPHKRNERNQYYMAAKKQLSSTLDPLLDVNRLHHTMRNVIRSEPYQERGSKEGRFVPLFKSTMYNIRYPVLSLYARRYHLDYSKLYQELTQHIFEPYTPALSTQQLNAIAEYIKGGNEATKTPPASVLEIKEYLRCSMIAHAWESTKDYLAIVVADRQLADDPIIAGMENVIRFSIHSKPGQIGLETGGNPVQPWHGTAQLRPTKKNKVKFGIQTALCLEAGGSIPVVVKALDAAEKSSGNGFIDMFIDSGQPLFYVHPDIGFSGALALGKTLSDKLVRT